MAPKIDSTKLIQQYEYLSDCIHDLADDIKETEKIGKSIANKPAMKPLFEARLSRLDSAFKKFRESINEAKRLASNLELQGEIEKLNALKSSIGEIFYQAIAIGMQERSVSESRPSIETTVRESEPQINLPRIDLPSFNGEISSWMGFKDTFLSLIHNNLHLSNIQKFHYLKSALKGSASQTISAISLTADNYDQAWECLTKRYDNKRLQATNYLANIFNYKPIQKINFNSLEQFSQIVLESAQAFINLNIPDPAGFVLYTFALRLLDQKTRERFESECASKTDIPDFKEFSNFIHQLHLQLQSNSLTSGQTGPKLSEGFNKNTKQVLMSNDSSNNFNVCPVCKQRHRLYHCPKFVSSTPTKRYNMAKNYHLCLNCLSPSHITPNCQSSRTCQSCSRKHHSMLHFSNNNFDRSSNNKVKPTEKRISSTSKLMGDLNHTEYHPPVPKNSAPQNLTDMPNTSSVSQSTVLASATSGKFNVLLGTAQARIQDNDGNYHPVRLVIDSGAQRSFITLDCANRLGLRKTKNPHALSGFAGSPISGGKYQVNCKLTPKTSPDPQLVTNAVVVPRICDQMPTTSVPIRVKNYFSDFELSDPSFWKPGSIDCLLGADLFGELFTGERIITPQELPNCFKTVFGWVLIGPIGHTNIENNDLSLMAVTQPSLDDIMHKFWQIEEVNQVKCENPLHVECENYFLNTHSRDQTGRYIVRLPFVKQPVELGQSFPTAQRRFQKLELQLNKNSSLKNDYSQVMKDYIAKGYVTLASQPGMFFLPHHGVVKDSSSTKLRIVFDASASTNNGSSLNDMLLVGPKLQQDIRDVLLNFRLYKFAFTTDISEMYLQILVHPEDRLYQHFLYRFDTTDAVQEWELTRVCFGVSSSPYLAIRVIEQLVKDEGSPYPLASKALAHDIYIDDILSGSDSLEKALRLQKELISLLGRGGFSLKKWASNSEELLRNLPQQSREVPISLSNLEEPSFKILGMQWSADDDCLSYKVQNTKLVLTKRGIMSTIARMYDPLGYLAPVIFKAKTILQNLWKSKLEWDSPISSEIETEWKLVFYGLSFLRNIKIPRCIVPNGIKCAIVLGFADASFVGYAAVVYLRLEDFQGNVNVRLIFAKTRLAPLKTLSIPRLELSAALLLVQTLNTLRNVLSKLPVSSTYLFTDSSITLSWLRLPSYQLKTFVANRVVQILDSSAIEDWYHIQSSDNAADIASRGIEPSQFLNCLSWWTGPDWCQEPPDKWPISKQFTKVKPPETKFEILTLLNNESEPFLIQLTEKFSSFEKLILTVAIMLRFIHNVRSKPINRTIGPITLAELKNASYYLIKATQQHYYPSKSALKCSNLSSLSPFVDSRGVIRVGGRLENSPLSYEERHPVLLPTKARLSALTVDHFHRSYLHAGPQLLHSLLQRRYWIVSSRKLIRSRIHKCVDCHRFRTKNFTPIMAALPPTRFSQGRPFLNVGVDYAGPFITKEVLRKRAIHHKSYVCLFVCMSTKAVHLELVSELTTKAFLGCLDRFIARRGLPTKIMSDHGTNFIGADRYLKEMFSWFNCQDIQLKIGSHLQSQQIKWEFIPPSAPHFGGIWEAGVKSFKYHLYRVIKDRVLTFEEFQTLLARIEAVLNSRPLYPMSSSPDDYDVLTPGHFIIGAPLLSVPEEDLTQEKENRLDRWQLLRGYIQLIWQRWRYDYLNSLQQKTKWKNKTSNIELNTLVLLKEPNVPPLCWPTGRVIELFPGPDGVVRVVKLKTPKGEYVRPVSKLAPLLPEDV